MSNRYFNFAASAYRLIRSQFARSAWVNDRLDEVTAGFGTVQTEMDTKAPSASPTFTGTVNLTGATTNVASPGTVSENSSKAAPTSWVQTLIGAASTLLPVQTGNAGKLLTTNGISASWATFFQTVTKRAITSTASIGAADVASLISATSGTFTATFAAPATLGTSWWTIVSNDGTGDVTVSHTSGNIDGLASYVMYPGETRLFQCDGSTIASVVLRAFRRRSDANFTFTKPPGYQQFAGNLWAGGGGGGKGDGTGSAGGGGGGACVPFRLPASAFGATESVTIAAATSNKTTTGAGAAGNNSTLGSLVTAYGGGAGAGVAATNSIAGGGGGGALSSGTSATNTTGVAGGNPGPGSNATTSGAGFGGGFSAANAAWGGGGGGAGNNAGAGSVGGSAVYGGGGGAGSGSTGTASGGTSVFGGAGGTGGNGSTNGSDGTVPGGGGGATQNGTQAGAGAGGRIDIWGE